MKPADIRAESLIIFQKLHRDLASLGDDFSDKKIMNLFLEAINLLPDYSARPSEEPDVVLVKRLDDPGGEEHRVNLRERTDSLRMVWAEYLAHSEPEP